MIENKKNQPKSSDLHCNISRVKNDNIHRNQNSKNHVTNVNNKSEKLTSVKKNNVSACLSKSIKENSSQSDILTKSKPMIIGKNLKNKTMKMGKFTLYEKKCLIDNVNFCQISKLANASKHNSAKKNKVQSYHQSYMYDSGINKNGIKRVKIQNIFKLKNKSFRHCKINKVEENYKHFNSNALKTEVQIFSTNSFCRDTFNSIKSMMSYKSNASRTSIQFSRKIVYNESDTNEIFHAVKASQVCNTF